MNLRKMLGTRANGFHRRRASTLAG